jgi:hypothetical protein
VQPPRFALIPDALASHCARRRRFEFHHLISRGGHIAARLYKRPASADFDRALVLVSVSAKSRWERPNMTDAKLVMLSSFRPARAGAKDAPSAAEGLKLVKAFLQIDDSKRRAEILRLVEEASAAKSG